MCARRTIRAKSVHTPEASGNTAEATWRHGRRACSSYIRSRAFDDGIACNYWGHCKKAASESRDVRRGRDVSWVRLNFEAFPSRSLPIYSLCKMSTGPFELKSHSSASWPFVALMGASSGPVASRGTQIPQLRLLPMTSFRGALSIDVPRFPAFCIIGALDLLISSTYACCDVPSIQYDIGSVIIYRYRPHPWLYLGYDGCHLRTQVLRRNVTTGRRTNGRVIGVRDSRAPLWNRLARVIQPVGAALLAASSSFCECIHELFTSAPENGRHAELKLPTCASLPVLTLKLRPSCISKQTAVNATQLVEMMTLPIRGLPNQT